MIRVLRDTPPDVALGVELVREYVVATAEELGQDIDLILTLIPDLHDFGGRYFAGGAFLVAEIDDNIAGGVGVTPGHDGVCEMNRLWVRPSFRRNRLARALAQASMDVARDLGFSQMILDVVPERAHAIALYRGLGFTDAPPAHKYPFPMIFLSRIL